MANASIIKRKSNPLLAFVHHIRPVCYIIPFALLLSQCRPKKENNLTVFAGKPEVPQTIKKEHAYLLAELQKFTLYPDSTGRAAKKLNDLVLHHFREEEDYVLPPLGLLPLLKSGNMPSESKDVILLTEKLKSQYEHMIAEHQLIKAFLNELIRADTNINHVEIIEFEKALQQHATLEEEIFFPTALLIGEYLKSRTR